MSEFSMVYNINFILLYLIVSVLYMLATNRRMLVSVRLRDVITFDGLLLYVGIGVIQSLSVAAVEDYLLRQGHSLFSSNTTFLLFGALIVAVWIGRKLGRIPTQSNR
jgi:hypothetical protein